MYFYSLKKYFNTTIFAFVVSLLKNKKQLKIEYHEKENFSFMFCFNGLVLFTGSIGFPG
jgi:hypothetical protein